MLEYRSIGIRDRLAVLRAPLAAAGVLCGLWCLAGRAGAAELKLFDGRRVAALIEAYDGKGALTVYLTSGEQEDIALRDVSAIYFSGRPDHFIRTGDQRFLFTAGGHVCAAIEKLADGNSLELRSQSLGRHVVAFEGGLQHWRERRVDHGGLDAGEVANVGNTLSRAPKVGALGDCF